jgi:signal transduction histidine kinase
LAVAAPLPPDEDGEVSAVVTGFQDVTALRELADARDRFLRIASHELRSPITALRATTSLLDLDPQAIADPERRGLMLTRIHRQVDRLIKLVEQLLDSSRARAGVLPIEPTECDLVELAREAIALAASASPGASARITLEADRALPGVWDPLRIEQVITNLTANALRYSSPDSPVQLTARAVGADHVELSVIDRGIGIPRAELDRVFSPFFRASNALRDHHTGLGLGLHVASEIVRRHGGRLSVESVLGEGSRFIAILPRQTRP